MNQTLTELHNCDAVSLCVSPLRLHSLRLAAAALSCRCLFFFFRAFVKNYGVRTVLWNFILVGLLIVLGALTMDLRRHADGGDHFTALLG